MARVLIVLDGEFRFSIGTALNPDFTYTALVEALTGAGHTVTKAHRADLTTDTSLGVLQPFHFDTGNLLNYDVIWLIGWSGRNENPDSTVSSGAGIGNREIAAIARFMEAGGGVFATGDHDSVGSEMGGRIPRVRAMRSWFGATDSAPEKPAGLPPNFPRVTALRADTTQRNPTGHYDDPAPPPDYVWFDNQSDSVPQTIVPVPPTHPILRRAGADISVYPDHMHEGNTLGAVMGYNYEQTLSFDHDLVHESFVEFPGVPGSREVPRVIARGQTVPYASRYVATGALVGGDMFTETSAPNVVNTLSVYDGRVAGVGRIVTGSTFHHYVDINLTGSSVVNTDDLSTKVGPNARKDHGLSDDHDKFDQIKTVFDNITNWLARPRPRIQIILERSTFSQAEAIANPDVEGAILVTVDGLKPNQFPTTGGVTSLVPAAFQPAWAPTITPPMEPAGLHIVATKVDSDDPMLSDRLQRLTFTYRVEVDAAAAFEFPGTFNHVQVDATLTSAALAGPLTDSAQITLVRSANPFMLDLEDHNTTPWLSSDVKVFPIVAGRPGSGLVNEASRDDAIAFLRARLSTMTDGEFTGLSGNEEASALSPYDRTTVSGRKVYNFAVARVRMPPSGASADQVRVFFRIVKSPTTAALTYNESMGVPAGSYKESSGAIPIAIPGTNAAGSEWWSFPCFQHTRISPPEMQIDDDNLKDHLMPGSSTFFGALLDNNLNDAYLPSMPGGAGAVGLPMLMMGAHQCIVAQIKYTGTPIPDGANPFTSDKLSQRNLAFSEIANPGLDASRMALHTFEIEATPNPVSDALPPDELLLDWRGAEPPDGTEVRLFVPGWNADQVFEMADRFYPRHEMRAVDAHTVALPGGGVRYVPIPSNATRQTGILIADFPLGVKQGQRFDLAVRQVTTRRRQVTVTPKVTEISRAEAARLLQGLTVPANQPSPAGDAPPRGVFDLGGNRTLVTDLSVYDAAGDHALIIEHPDPVKEEAARNESGRWRETIGAFQLGIPVSFKADMLAHHMRLLSVLRWRAERLRPNDRWYATFIRYVELIAEKVRALGGDPFSVPATPDGIIPLPGKNEDQVGCVGWLVCLLRTCIRLLTGGHERP